MDFSVAKLSLEIMNQLDMNVLTLPNPSSDCISKRMMNYSKCSCICLVYLVVQTWVGKLQINHFARKEKFHWVSRSWGEDSLAPTKNHLTFLDDEPDEENENGCKHTQNGGPYFKEAKECLLSLKISIEVLHQKNLFPYNPNVLLNCLTRFQELCFEEEK
ncbi:unnamed protein product [Prunus armeniaca]